MYQRKTKRKENRFIIAIELTERLLEMQFICNFNDKKCKQCDFEVVCGTNFLLICVKFKLQYTALLMLYRIHRIDRKSLELNG